LGLNIGDSVFSAIGIAGALLLLGACSSHDPTSFGSTIGREGAGAASASVSASFGLGAAESARGFNPRDLTSCSRGPVPDYAVTTFLPEPKIDTDLSLRQIGRLMKVDERHMALGATVSHEVIFALMTVDVRPSTAGGVCAYPTRIAFTLSLTARKIHVASDFARAEPCVYREVLAHEERHVALDNRLMNIAADALRVTAPKRLADLYGVWGESDAVAKQNLQHRLEADDQSLRLEIERKRVEAHAEAIDTPEERTRLVEACAGRLEKLYPGYL
jgi:hypothetical protein